MERRRTAVIHIRSTEEFLAQFVGPGNQPNALCTLSFSEPVILNSLRYWNVPYQKQNWLLTIFLHDTKVLLISKRMLYRRMLDEAGLSASMGVRLQSQEIPTGCAGIYVCLGTYRMVKLS